MSSGDTYQPSKRIMHRRSAEGFQKMKDRLFSMNQANIRPAKRPAKRQYPNQEEEKASAINERQPPVVNIRPAKNQYPNQEEEKASARYERQPPVVNISPAKKQYPNQEEEKASARYERQPPVVNKRPAKRPAKKQYPNQEEEQASARYERQPPTVNIRPAKKQYPNKEDARDGVAGLIGGFMAGDQHNGPKTDIRDTRDGVAGLIGGFMVGDQHNGPKTDIRDSPQPVPDVTKEDVVEKCNPHRKGPKQTPLEPEESEEIVSHFKNELGINIFKGSLGRPTSRTRGMLTGENRMQQTQNNYGFTRERLFPTTTYNGFF